MKHTQVKRTMRQSNRVTSRKKKTTGKSGKMSSNYKHIWKLMPAPDSGQEDFSSKPPTKDLHFLNYDIVQA